MWIIIFAALLYSLAYWNIDVLWVLAFPGLFLMIFCCVSLSKKNAWGGLVGAMTVWGLIVFAIHFTWLPALLRNKLGLSLPLTAGLSGIVVIFFLGNFVVCWIAASGLIFLLSKLKNDLLIAAASMILCFLSIESIGKYPIFIIGQDGAYRLLSPMIACSKGIDALNGIFSWYFNKISNEKKIQRIRSCICLKEKFGGISVMSKSAWEQMALFQDELRRLRRAGRTIFVTPESWLPLPLNRHPEFLLFFQNCLEPGEHVLVASQFLSPGGERYQALYWLTDQGLQVMRCKSHAIGFVEKIPPFFEKCTILKTAFGADSDFSIARRDQAYEPWVRQGCQVLCYVCSEFFLQESFAGLQKRCAALRDSVIVVVVNDSYFTTPIKRLLKATARLQEQLAGVAVVYVGY